MEPELIELLAGRRLLDAIGVRKPEIERSAENLLVCVSWKRKARPSNPSHFIERTLLICCHRTRKVLNCFGGTLWIKCARGGKDH